MRIKQEKTPDDFKNIDKIEFYRLWFKKALTMRQIAKMYGITREEVNHTRKEVGYTTFKCAFLSIMGGEKYK